MKNSKIPICITFAFFAFGLCACAPIEFEEYPDGTSGTSVNTTGRLTPDSTDALPVETQLILGTLLLEGTDQAVDAKQAAVLLPLWEQWHDMNRSNAAAPGDRDTLLAQIQSAMTEKQIQAIAAMNLTLQDVFTYIEKNGVGFSPQTTGTPEGPNPGGTPPPDNDDLPGSGFDQTQTLSPEELATLQSVYQGGFGGSHGPEWALLHALIQLLESKQQA
jgi:hypothetical protein